MIFHRPLTTIATFLITSQISFPAAADTNHISATDNSKPSTSQPQNLSADLLQMRAGLRALLDSAAQNPAFLSSLGLSAGASQAILELATTEASYRESLRAYRRQEMQVFCSKAASADPIVLAASLTAILEEENRRYIERFSPFFGQLSAADSSILKRSLQDTTSKSRNADLVASAERNPELIKAAVAAECRS